MEKASRVMYSIANFFTWILLILSVVGIVLGILSLTGVLQLEGEAAQLGTVAYLIYLGIIFIVCWITIAMVRRAKAAGSSKGWDFFFLICGIIGANIFYFLGGLFGLIAPRRK